MRKFGYTLFILVTWLLIAQNGIAALPTNDSLENVIRGIPILRVFANFTAPVGESTGNTSFEVRRAYLGYDYKLEKKWSMKVVLDIGSPNDDSPYSRLKRYAYFKTAALTYRAGNLQINAGIIDLLNVELQEKLWGYRYIFKSFMDEYKFGPRADIGVNLILTPAKYLSLDAMIMNGEGYEQLQNDITYKASVGITAKPVHWLFVRMYTEYSQKKISESIVAGLIGFDWKKKYALSVETNMRFNENFVDDHNRYGYSIYGRAGIFEKYGVFARYDWVSSNKAESLDQPWNLAKDGSAIITGIEYCPISRVRFALNYQDWFPYAANVKNRRSVFLNLEFRL